MSRACAMLAAMVVQHRILIFISLSWCCSRYMAVSLSSSLHILYIARGTS